MKRIQLGDLTVLDPDLLPGKLVKALAVIADRLHPAFDEQDWLPVGKSKDSCVLVSLTVRDFLNSIGIKARVRPVTCLMRSERDGKELHTLGIGAPAAAGSVTPEKFRWNGHLVVTVPRHSLLIDTTLHTADRPQWEGAMPKMIALHYSPNLKAWPMYGCKPIAGTEYGDGEGFRFSLVYLDRPDNTGWRNGPDASQTWRHAAVQPDLRERFGVWDG